MFSITGCPPVLQTTVCVAPRARRRSAPACFLGSKMAALPSTSSSKDQRNPALSGFEPQRPPRITSKSCGGLRNRVVIATVGASRMYCP